MHADARWLFTGDILHWNHRRDGLDVLAGAMIHSWQTLADSMDRLATLPVEWVFPGHGHWHRVGVALHTEQMDRLGLAMREIGRSVWTTRPSDACDRY